jgi:hypothetical protein
MDTPTFWKALTWILRHLGCGPNDETVTGDLIERYRKGRSRSWRLWQVGNLLLLNFRGGLLGLAAGAVTAAGSVAGNVRRNDLHGISFFPDVLSLLVLIVSVCLIVRHWHQTGMLPRAVRRALRQAAVSAAFLTTVSHYLFALWWFHESIPMSQLWILVQHIAAIGFVMVVFIVIGTGSLASRILGSRRASLE